MYPLKGNGRVSSRDSLKRRLFLAVLSLLLLVIKILFALIYCGSFSVSSLLFFSAYYYLLFPPFVHCYVSDFYLFVFSSSTSLSSFSFPSYSLSSLLFLLQFAFRLFLLFIIPLILFPLLFVLSFLVFRLCEQTC